MAATDQTTTSAQPDPLRHHEHLQGKEDDKNLFGESLMERLSEKVAEGMGTVGFILVSAVIIIAWVFINHAVKFFTDSYHGLINGKGFDPEPWILLNLVFSAVAFFTGALVIIAQKAQAKRDRASAVGDAKHREELAQTQIDLIKQNTEITQRIDKLTAEVHAHIEEVHAHITGEQKK